MGAGVNSSDSFVMCYLEVGEGRGGGASVGVRGFLFCGHAVGRACGRQGRWTCVYPCLSRPLDCSHFSHAWRRRFDSPCPTP